MVNDRVVTRHLEMGAQLAPEGISFRAWAPAASTVEVELIRPEGVRYLPMDSRPGGVHEGFLAGGRAGQKYRFRLDGRDSFPDPYSRSQPEGIHGPSEVVDPQGYLWHDHGWPGLTPEGLVIYECHVGSYTPSGTFLALAGQLPELKRLGITALQLMPVAEFPGERNWGYDGVDLYAPSHVYGGPDGLKLLVDAAHREGIGVILDVVYNHLGPDGNYLRAYSPSYFTDRPKTTWGDALNYDGPDSFWVREYVLQNACSWISEYHLDGLRLDATHALFDDSSPHLLQELSQRARAAGQGKSLVLLAENDGNDVRLCRPVEAGGYGLDGVLADDFHHSVRVMLTGDREGYYQDYRGTCQEIACTLEESFLYQGQPSPHLKRPRGTPVTDEPASAFVFCLQNHDQVGNNPFGFRLHHLVEQDRFMAASVLLLLAPETPLIFMGQEFATSSPFLYFTDHEEELGRLVTEGRRQEFSYLQAFKDEALRSEVPDPQALGSFLRSKLKLEERETHAPVYRLYRDLLHLRRSDPVFRSQDRKRTKARGLGSRIVGMHRWLDQEHRLVLANLGPGVQLSARDLSPLIDQIPDTPRLQFSVGTEAAVWRSLPADGAHRDPAIRLDMPAFSALVCGWREPGGPPPV